jgi:hypothetical protein
VLLIEYFNRQLTKILGVEADNSGKSCGQTAWVMLSHIFASVIFAVETLHWHLLPSPLLPPIKKSKETTRSIVIKIDFFISKNFTDAVKKLFAF